MRTGLDGCGVVEGTRLLSGADNEGYYRLEGVPSGKRVLKLQAVGYKTVPPQEVDVQPNRIVLVDFKVEFLDSASE